MTKLLIDYNDQMYGRGRYRVRPGMQPGGRLPALQAGMHVLVGDPDEGEMLEAVLELDPRTNTWIADTSVIEHTTPKAAEAHYA